ncbi:MAG: DUF924 family protein [Pseudomonadota bacterium]
MTHDPNEILRFWLEDCGPDDWYKQDDALDAAIRDRFEETWAVAAKGGLDDWWTPPEWCLAFLILTDQFPRNMFRGQAKAFSTDEIALRTAKWAIERGIDLRIDGPARQFFYLPLGHSEYITDQHRAVRLVATRLDAPETLLHAQAHREVIRRFGRFPHRNEVLGRAMRGGEAAFLADGGYGAVVRELKEAA